MLNILYYKICCTLAFCAFFSGCNTTNNKSDLNKKNIDIDNIEEPEKEPEKETLINLMKNILGEVLKTFKQENEKNSFSFSVTKEIIKLREKAYSLIKKEISEAKHCGGISHEKLKETTIDRVKIELLNLCLWLKLFKLHMKEQENFSEIFFHNIMNILLIHAI